MVKVIFITGGSASGKTTLANQLQKAFGDKALLISQDMFYKPTRDPEVNYDVPAAFDFDHQERVLKSLIANHSVEIPIYDMSTYDSIGTEVVRPRQIIIFEGLFTFHHKELLKLADIKIFVDTPADTRLGRRILRDVFELKRDVRDVIKRWNEYVQPSYRKYISGTKQTADMVIPWTTVNHRAIGFLVATISELGNIGNLHESDYNKER